MTEEESHFQKQLELLRRHRKSIVADLDVQDVIPDLLRQLILLHDDKQRIDSEKTLEDKANELINIIERKAVINNNRDALPVFIGALKLKYSWLYAKLAEDVPDSKPPLGNGDSNSATNVKKKQDDISRSGSIHQKGKNTLEAGGVPWLPVFAVERKYLQEAIIEEFHELKRNQYLVLQGMAGCGKSVAVTQACHSLATSSTKLFEHGIFWLSIGKECSETKDAILAKMRILCEKLEESRAPNSLEHGAELLRTAFIKRSNAILILDDVWRPEVIRAFDVGCRTVVTTRDISVMDVVQGRIKWMKVSDGFTETESLQLFSQALGVPNDKALPEEALAIHLESKGSPMVVSLIAALIHDHESSDEGRWNYYLEALAKRKYSKMRRSREYEHESVIDAIALSVESLSEKHRNYYSDFALLQDDVGIPCPVLMVLWNLGKYEVEDVMRDLVRKSLATDEYDPLRKCNIYSIHDLQLDYLKYQLRSSESAEKELHSKLIDKYLSVSDSQFHNLPDDGYIHFHLGYHLYKAGRNADFPRAYLNLLFIGEKIRITGAADLLIDLRKYSDFIFGDYFEERSVYIDQLKTFTQLVGHRLYGQMDVDIVQLALQTPNLQEIYNKARKLANSTPHRLYLEWKNWSGAEWKNPESTVLCSDNVRCVKFVGTEGNYFLAALNNGCIELCDLVSSAVFHLFSGHQNAVQSLDVFQCDSNPFIGNGKAKFIFLSSSEDKTCKLWDLKPVFQNLDRKTSETSLEPGGSPSPKIRPDHWTFEKLIQRDDSYLTFAFHTAPLSYAEFSRDGSQIVSTSMNEIMVWNSENGQVLSKISLPSSAGAASSTLSFQSCRFPYEDDDDTASGLSYLIASAENQLVLFSVDRPSLYSSVEGHHMRIIAILLLSEYSFCTVSENEIGLWKIMRGKTPPHSRSLSPRKSVGNPFTTVLSTESNSSAVSAKTVADALPNNSFESQNSGNYLRPSDFGERKNSGSSTGRKSPTLSSDCYSPTNVSTILDTGSDFVKIWREEVLPRKSTGLFQCAAISQNELLLACGTSDRKIILWNLNEKCFLGEFSSHNGWLRSLDFSTVDKWTLLSGSEDHTVMVWDVDEEQKGRKEPYKLTLFSSVYVQTPELLNPGYFLSIFVTDINTVQIFIDSRRILESVALSTPISSVCLSNCGTFGIVGTKEGRILRLKDLKTNMRKKSPGRAASAESDGYSLQTDFEFVGSLGASIKFIKFSANGVYLVAGSTCGTVMILKEFHAHRLITCEGIFNCHFLFEDFLALICSKDAIAVIHHLDTGKEFQGYQNSDISAVTCSVKKVDSSAIVIGTSHDGVFICSTDEKVGIVETRVISCGHNTAVRSLAFSSDGIKLAIGHDNGVITIWDLSGDIYIEEADYVLHKSSVRFLLFSPMFVGEGRWLVSCGDRLAVWSIAKPEERVRKPSFMEERRRRKSGESRPSSRLSLDISEGIKIGRQGKRELLQTFWFHGAYAKKVVSNINFSEFLTVDDTGVLYFIETMKGINPGNSNYLGV